MAPCTLPGFTAIRGPSPLESYTVYFQEVFSYFGFIRGIW